MKRIFAQARKELQQFSRDRLTVALAFLLPFLALLLFGFAVRLESKDIPLAIENLDGGAISRAYSDRFFASNQFVRVAWPPGEPAAAALDRGLARAALVIPPDFSRQIKAGKVGTVQVLIDGTDANNARVIRNSVRTITDFYLGTANLQGSANLGGASPTVSASLRLWFNPGRREALYIVPGTIAVILWIFPSLLAALAMVREKEQGTALQIYASDLSAGEWLLGKAAAYFAIALAEALIVIVPGAVIFDLKLAGDPSPLIVGTVIFLLSSVLFGLLIGSRTNTQSVAVQGVSTIGFLSSLLLSGFIYPIINIPFPLSLLSNLVPARYYIELTRDAFVRGAGWEGIWFAPVAMALLSAAFFAIARKSLGSMQLSE